MSIVRSFTRTLTFTRPADTTQYAAGDAVSDNTTTATAATFTLKNMASMGGMGGVLHSITFHKTDQDLTGADFDIYLFATQPAGTTYEDNAAIAITDAVFQTCVGFVSLTGSTEGRSVATGDFYNKTNLDMVYEATDSDGSLYPVVVARGTYTPASEEVFTIKFGCLIQ